MYANILSTIALLVAGLSAYYTWRQSDTASKSHDLVDKDVKERKRQEADENRFYERFDRLRSQLCRIGPNCNVLEPGTKEAINLYNVLYPGQPLRWKIEKYIIKAPPSGYGPFEPRNPQPHELKAADLLDTVDKAERRMSEFLAEHPFFKQHAGVS